MKRFMEFLAYWFVAVFVVCALSAFQMNQELALITTTFVA